MGEDKPCFESKGFKDRFLVSQLSTLTNKWNFIDIKKSPDTK